MENSLNAFSQTSKDSAAEKYNFKYLKNFSLGRNNIFLQKGVNKVTKILIFL